MPARLAVTAWIAFGLAVDWTIWQRFDVTTTDFYGFLRSTRALMGWPALSPTHAVDLNTPVVALLLTPLAWMDPTVAFWIWTGAGGVMLAGSLRLIARTVPLSGLRIGAAVGALLATAPMLPVWRAGELTPLLTLLVTLAWCAKPKTAGIWLGLAVAVKPPLALMALLLPWRIWTTAGITSVALVVLSVGLVGMAPWLDWLALGQSVTWLNAGGNLSAWGFVGRIAQPDSLTLALDDFSPAQLVLIGGLILVPLAGVVRTQGSSRWIAALCWSLWASPLGWSYYVPLVLGPWLVVLPASALTWIGLALLTVPPPAVSHLWLPWISVAGLACWLSAPVRNPPKPA